MESCRGCPYSGQLCAGTSSPAVTRALWPAQVTLEFAGLQGSICFSLNEFCQFCVFVKGLVCGWQVKSDTD